MVHTSNFETYRNRDGIKVIERFFDLPLDHSRPANGQTIRVFARNLVPLAKARTPEEEANLPYRGPGFECALPDGSSGFAAEIHERGYQTLWLDQRGTGLSTPILHDTLPSHLVTDRQKADYFKYFRADSIVKDCEAIRKSLLGHKSNKEDQSWTVLGQSFGGFCALTYLSLHPEGLKEVFMTGGLAPLSRSPEKNYEAVIHRVIKRNKIYYEKYPQDVQRVRNLASYLDTHEVTVPNGGRLSVSRLQGLGIDFGIHGGIDRVHQLIFKSSNDLDLFGKLSYRTVEQFEQATSFDAHPVYAVLHEPIYCQGHAANWSAHRTLQTYPQLFSWGNVNSQSESTPLYFTGEMVLPDMYDDYAGLRPLKGVAELLSQDTNWGPLYDRDQLSKNTVKVSAVSYFDDMYVDFNLSQETAAQISNIEQYVTNQLFHSGVREDPKDVIKRLFQISKREYY